MVTRIYKSSDAGAPALTGQIDSLNNLLKAILINGIGAVPASPWTLSFEDIAAHVCVFRPPAGNRHYLQVNDNGPGGATYREARMRGFVAMTGFNTGTELFPTVAQLANGLFVRKSLNLDTGARVWRAMVDEKTMYLFIDSADLPGNFDMYAFGNYLDWNPTSTYGSMIIGRIQENNASHASFTNAAATVYASAAVASQIFTPRDYSGAANPQSLGALFDAAACNTTTSMVPGAAGTAYPYPVDAGIILMPYRLATPQLAVGRLRGVWIPGHNKPLVQDDVFTATEGALTRAFIAQNFLGTGQLMVETSATWDTD